MEHESPSSEAPAEPEAKEVERPGAVPDAEGTEPRGAAPDAGSEESVQEAPEAEDGEAATSDAVLAVRVEPEPVESVEQGAAPKVLSRPSRLPHALLHRVELALAAPKGRDVKLERVCQVLAANVAHYDWVGFYLTDPGAPRELVLGPYVGEPTEHARIPFGKGICGQAADRGETFVVQDVSQESNYLSCSPYVKSEIVVPILRDGVVLGELDIDSHELAPFTDEDRSFLEQVAALVADVL